MLEVSEGTRRLSGSWDHAWHVGQDQSSDDTGV